MNNEETFVNLMTLLEHRRALRIVIDDDGYAIITRREDTPASPRIVRRAEQAVLTR